MNFTQGFNPVPKASFSPALPVGTESLAEYLDIDLVDAITNEAELLESLNNQLPAGITIKAVSDVPDKKNAVAEKSLISYQIKFDRSLSGEDKEKLKNFMSSESYSITKFRKGKKRVIDVRKQVESLVESADNSIEMILLIEAGKAAIKPVEILKAVLELTREQSLNMSILKVWNRSSN